jgi:hypothetical protein
MGGLIPEPTARVLIPHGYLHPGVWEHSEVQSCPPLCDGRSSTLCACASTSLQPCTKKMFFILQRCISLFYNIFLRCISLLTGNKPAVSWISGCQPWNKFWKACINTNFVEDEKSKFNSRCLGHVWDLDKCYKHFSIKIPYRTYFVIKM